MTIGYKIKVLRLGKGWTQVQMGNKVGFPDSRIGSYERDEHKPTKRTLEKIASIFSISWHELVADTDLDEKNEYSGSSDGYEVEYCNNCESEIELRWDINKEGFQAVCPVCGSRLMLCDACKHRFGGCFDDCDYDSVTDKCRFSRPVDWWRNKDAKKMETGRI